MENKWLSCWSTCSTNPSKSNDHNRVQPLLSIQGTPTEINHDNPISPAPVAPVNNNQRQTKWKNHGGLFKQYRLLKINKPLSDPKLCLVLKEICNISDSSYKFLHKVNAIPEWSTFYAVQKYRKELNTNLKMFPSSRWISFVYERCDS